MSEEMIRMLALRKQLDPDAPDMVAIPQDEDGYVAWCRYVNDGNKIVPCDSDANGAFKVYPSPPDANRYREKFNEAERTIQKVWEALGISTYEQAKPYAIWEHVERLRAAVLAEVREAVEGQRIVVRDAKTTLGQLDTCHNTAIDCALAALDKLNEGAKGCSNKSCTDGWVERERGNQDGTESWVEQVPCQVCGVQGDDNES